MNKTCFACGTRAPHCPHCGACHYRDLDGCDECGYASPRLLEVLGHEA